MVAAISTHFDRRLYPAVDEADKESAQVFTKVGATVYELSPAERSRWMKATEPVYSHSGFLVNPTQEEF